ncbi:MAG: hypothetical protein ACFE95_19690 [Candidatus Hodarchaeota archaeon]
MENKEINDFKKEWKEVSTNYPNVARAYATQQIALIQVLQEINSDICDRVRRGEILMAEEAFKKYCLSIKPISEESLRLNALLDCLKSHPDPDYCFRRYAKKETP